MIRLSYLLLIATVAPILSYNLNDETIFKFMEESIFQKDIGKTMIQLLEKPLPHELHTVTFGLKHLNVDQIDEKLNDISNPRSPNYGNYLSYNEIVDLCVPHQSINFVEKYFNSVEIFGQHLLQISFKSLFKISRKTLAGEYISITAPIWVLNKLFKTEFYKFQNINPKHVTSLSSKLSDESTTSEESSLYAYRALAYSLPLELFDHIGTVFNTVQHPFAVHYIGDKKHTAVNTGHNIKFPQPQTIFTKQQESTRSGDDGGGGGDAKKDEVDPPIPTLPWYYEDGGYVTPAMLKKHYDVFVKGTNSSPAQCVYASIGQTYSMADLLAFETVFNLDQTPIMNTKRFGHKIVHTCNHPESCLEANLDVQYMVGVGQGIPTTYWYEPDYSSSSFTVFLADVNNDPNPPKVISISYGMSESVVSPVEKYFFDLEAKKLLLRGVTIIAASGDAGATNAVDIETCGYNPIFPASSIYMTTIGATQGAETPSGVETACEMVHEGVVTSGGGFSYIYATPAWQKRAVDRYFDITYNRSATVPYQDQDAIDNLKNTHRIYPPYPNPAFNAKGRGYPDISITGLNYVVVTNMSFYALSGTSASTPAFSAMIALINAARVSSGKSVLGWINPALYSVPASELAADIPEGDNRCYGFENLDQCCQEGFFGAPGWDPVTGLGAANFRKLYNYLFNLPSFSAKPFVPVGTAAPTRTSAAASGDRDKKDIDNDKNRNKRHNKGDDRSSADDNGRNKDKAFTPYKLDGDDNINEDNSGDDAIWSFKSTVFVLIALVVILASIGYVFRYTSYLAHVLSCCRARLCSSNPGYQYTQLPGGEHAVKEAGVGLRGDDSKHIRQYGSLGVEIQKQPMSLV